jgi:5-methylcytosine-specific restriction endonuclease McrBC GTP-binding regulatory subunit McrB
MNLARIEYYFAEFLSIMEMPDLSEWKIDLVPDIWDSDPKMIINGKINIPQNVWFIGTANKDDSTFTITV